MKAVTFPQVTNLVAENQPQYVTLPSFVGEVSPGIKGIVCCFELDTDEVNQVKANGKLWLRVLTFGEPLQPFNIFTMKDYFTDEPKELMRADVNTKVLNGREIKYLDTIILRTKDIKFSFLDRLKILFGYSIQTASEVYTTHGHCNVVDSQSFIFIEEWSGKKYKSIDLKKFK